MLAQRIVSTLLSEDDVPLPRLSEIVSILRRHPLFKLRLPVKKGYLVGSFAGKKGQEHSDVDVLLIVDPQPGQYPQDVTQQHRRLLMKHFMTHNLRGKHDNVHPQWNGRRLDVYFAYEVPEDETRPLVELPE